MGFEPTTLLSHWRLCASFLLLLIFIPFITSKMRPLCSTERQSYNLTVFVELFTLLMIIGRI